MIHRLLSRLEEVREVGKDRWIARCPSHDDRTPSLSITEVDDRQLIHCHAGCDALSVVQAVGLSLVDLFDDHHAHRTPLKKPQRRIDYKSLVVLMRHEALVIWLAAKDLAAGRALHEDDVGIVQRALSNMNKMGSVHYEEG